MSSPSRWKGGRELRHCPSREIHPSKSFDQLNLIFFSLTSSSPLNQSFVALNPFDSSRFTILRPSIGSRSEKRVQSLPHLGDSLITSKKLRVLTTYEESPDLIDGYKSANRIDQTNTTSRTVSRHRS